MAGRLTSYADPNASTTAAFAYDATGQRVRTVTTQGSLTTTSTFTYDGLLLERTASERSDGTTLSLSYLFDEESAYQYCGGDPAGKVDPSGLYAHEFVPDLGNQTQYFVKVLRVNAGRTIRQKRSLSRAAFYGWFVNAVRPNGAWDLKLCAPSKWRFSSSFGFFATRISMEAFGNIHFG
ncbi:MAG: hypothetical protein LLG08_08665 [Actinomycetia bacterium]|nr:hypothetical protein [Actinomycetes bacterium]